MPGNIFLGPLLLAIKQHRPTFLLITGDITDLGSPQEWHNVITALKDANVETNIVLTPGNHDLNVAFGREPVTLAVNDSNTDFISRLDEIPRIARVYAVQAEFMPTLVSRDGEMLGGLLSRAPTRTTAATFSSEIDECTDECAINNIGVESGIAKARFGCYFGCKRNWRYIRNLYLRNLDQQFPWRFVAEQDGVAVFSIATTLRKTETMGRNAIGEIDDNQLASLRTAIENVPSTVKIFFFIFHHPVTILRGEPAGSPTLPVGTSNLKLRSAAIEFRRWWGSIRIPFGGQGCF